MKLKVVAVSMAAFGGFAVMGPLQHFGVVPQTVVGDASKAMIKSALNMSSKPAMAISNCNNGWGNGEDGAPGNSFNSTVGAKFEVPGTGTSPSGSPSSGGGNR